MSGNHRNGQADAERPIFAKQFAVALQLSDEATRRALDLLGAVPADVEPPIAAAAVVFLASALSQQGLHTSVVAAVAGVEAWKVQAAVDHLAKKSPQDLLL